MRQAMQRNVKKKQIAVAKPLPPPVGGWNAHDAISAMPTTDAVSLVNFVPDVGAVSVRPGYASWATGLGTYVESLMEHAPPSGSNKLFGAAGANIYDVTATGAVGAAVQSGLTSARWQHVMFATTGGNFLCMCNGADAPRYYDGAGWTNFGFTGSGLTLTNLINISSHMNRLWFIEKDTLHLWYLGVSSIAGTATLFDISGYARKGGYLVAMSSWTRDGGDGPDDMMAIVTSKGELFIYQGIDPTSMSFVGRFEIAEPIGRRCTMKAGADLAILTSQGLLPISQAIGVNESGQDTISFTNKIDGAFTSAFLGSGTNFGWQCLQYPKRNYVIVNVALAERSMQEQYVMNVKNGSWCRFTNMNANCWSLLGTNLYFGDNSGTVWQFDNGQSTDNSLPITASMQTAFSSFGSPNNKHFTMAKPLFVGAGGAVPGVTIKVDYDTASAGVTTTVFVDNGVAWDTSFWDTFYWAADAIPTQVWQNVAGLGVVGSIALSVAAPMPLSYNGSIIMYENGGVL